MRHNRGMHTEPRIVFMGTPEFAVPSLRALLAAGCQVVGVYTQPDRPAGRGREAAAGPVKRLAVELGIEVLQPRSLREPETVARLAGFAPDLMVVVAYGLLLPGSVLSLPRCGCLNVHPSLLPRYRGPSPIPWAILEGDPITGVTMMLMDEGMDTGPILEQVEEPLSDNDTTATLSPRLAALAARMLPATVDRWVRGEITPRPQENARASYSRLITKADGRIDWRLPAVVLWRRVRAFQPWPGCFTRWQGRTVKIAEVVPVEDVQAGPGQVVLLPPRMPGGCVVGVGTGRGVLGLLRLQLEGKNEVSAAEFLRGHPGFAGSRLEV